MKILQLIQKQQLRGAEIFASQLSAHLSEKGNTVILVNLFGGDAALPFDGQTTTLNGNQKARLHDVAGWRKLAQIIRDENPDVIQANAGDTLKYAVFSKIFFRWKQPIVFRNASTISLYVKTLPQRIWNGFLFRFTDKIISVSKTSANDFMQTFPGQKHKVITIPIGIEHVEFAAARNVKTNGRALLNGDGGIRIIHVGGFTFEKNHIELIDIFDLILKRTQSAYLYLVGDGPLKAEIEELVRKRGLSSRVKFCGFQKNAMDYIRSADVLVLPSIIEGLPGVILEAFYCRTPVVAYNVGGIREIVRHKETGRLIAQGDKTAFATAVIEATSDSPQNQKIISNAHDLVISDYLNREVVKKFVSAYESLVI